MTCMCSDNTSSSEVPPTRQPDALKVRLILNPALHAADAEAVLVSGGTQCQLHLAATADVQQQVSGTEHSVKAHTAGISQQHQHQQQQQQQALCSDQDVPECSPVDDYSAAVDPQSDALVMQQANQPAAGSAPNANTTQQASPSSLQASQPDAKITLDVALAAVKHKADLQPSQGVGSPPGRQDAVTPKAAVTDLLHMPVKQSGSQTSLSRRTLGSASAASGPAADVTDADLADKENDGSSLSLTGSDTQSKSQGLKEQQQGTAAAAAAAQVMSPLKILIHAAHLL